MKRRFFWMINAFALMASRTVFADETTAAAERAAEETTRVSAFNGNWILWALVIGFLIALMVTAMWKAQLRSVHSKWEASDYVRKDSLNLVSRNERFLFRDIQKVPIPKEQNNQGGHGGITFGGGMGGSGGHGGITFGGGTGGHGNSGIHVGTGFTLGGGHGGHGGSGGGLNYGGHLEPGAKPGSGANGRPGGLFGRGGAPGQQGRGPHRPE